MTISNKYSDPVTRIVRYLSEPKHAIHFLNQAYIASVSEIIDMHQYARSDGRKGLVLNAKENGIAANSQIFMDVKHGQSSTDQLCEAIYGAGTLSGHRIVIFTGTSSDDKDNPAANYELVSRLVKYNDSYNPTYLIRAIVSEGVNKPLQFHVDTRSESSSGGANSDLISERSFRELEFWHAYIESFDSDFYRGWSPPKAENFLNLAYGHFTAIGAFQIREGFNDFGAFVWVVQRNGGKDRLTEFWRVNQAKLKRLFTGAEMTLANRSGQSPTPTLKISDRPLGWLLGASVAEKLAFAKELHGKYLSMVNFIRKEA